MTHRKKIIFTGGGSAGHVVPNLALIDKALSESCAVAYIGSIDGLERALIESKKIPYFPIASGKFRRYFSLKNFLDPLKVLWAIVQSYFILRREKPVLVFSKGGFVSLPVVIAAWLHRIPVVAHESDISPGLTNRLSLPFVKALCVTFPEALKYTKTKAKVVVTGTPVRPDFFSADAERGRHFLGFQARKKIVLIMGGGLGAVALNHVVWDSIDALTKQFQVVHLCGKGKTNDALEAKDYRQFHYLDADMFDVMAAADIIVSRAGANSLYEFIALDKPHILIPLQAGSRGDQVLNAAYFEKLGLSTVIPQAALTPERLVSALSELNSHFVERKQALMRYQLPNAIDSIWRVIQESITVPH